MARSGGIRASGSDVLDAFTDSVTATVVPPSSANSITANDTPSDEAATATVSDSAAAAIRTMAAEGAALAAAGKFLWDGTGYSGSGNLLNTGTLGSGSGANDMVLGAATAAPSFAAGVFTFDGSNDYMAMADNAQQSVTDVGTLWIVCTPVATVAANSQLIGNTPADTAPGFALSVATSPVTTMVGTARASGSGSGGVTATLTAATKRLFFITRYSDGSNLIGACTSTAIVNSAFGPSQSGAMDPTLAMTIGARPGLTNFFKMTYNVAGFTDRAYSAASLQAIAANYGL